jgi:hypothetical protein
MIPLRTNVYLHSGIISRLNIARYKTKHYKKIYYVPANEAIAMGNFYNFTRLIIGRGNGYVIYDFHNLYFVSINEFEDLFEIIAKNCHSQINVKIEKWIRNKFNLTYDIIHNLNTNSIDGYRITFEGCYFPVVKLIPFSILCETMDRLAVEVFPTVKEAEQKLFNSLKICLYKTYRISGILPNDYIIDKYFHRITYARY